MFLLYLYMFCLVKLKDCTNMDLENIITPVKAQVLNKFLKDSGYDEKKTKFLVDGFTNGFSLEYEGKLGNMQRLAPNLKLRVGNKTELWNKVMNEVELGRYAGLFNSPPFDSFMQSPIGLVPKGKGTKTRLIFHLSFPKDGESVNSGIPYEKCKVKYPDFDEAVKLCLHEGVGCKMGKSDMSSAFRHVPMAKSQWWLLVIVASGYEGGTSYHKKVVLFCGQVSPIWKLYQLRYFSSNLTCNSLDC